MARTRPPSGPRVRKREQPSSHPVRREPVVRQHVRPAPVRQPVQHDARRPPTRAASTGWPAMIPPSSSIRTGSSTRNPGSTPRSARPRQSECVRAFRRMDERVQRAHHHRPTHAADLTVFWRDFCIRSSPPGAGAPPLKTAASVSASRPEPGRQPPPNHVPGGRERRSGSPPSPSTDHRPDHEPRPPQTRQNERDCSCLPSDRTCHLSCVSGPVSAFRTAIERGRRTITRARRTTDTPGRRRPGGSAPVGHRGRRGNTRRPASARIGRGTGRSGM